MGKTISSVATARKLVEALLSPEDFGRYILSGKKNGSWFKGLKEKILFLV